jgi:hypothetical protein
MLGDSDTPSERLEHRRYHYSGNYANSSVYDYLRQYLYDEKRDVISAHMFIKHDKNHTHTISIIMLHLIVVFKSTTFTSLKHNCLLLRIF